MKGIKETRIILFILIVAICIISEIGKSVRINQLKDVDASKIESIGNYEMKSKTEYPKILDSIKKASKIN